MKLQKTISVITSLATTISLSGVMMLAPMAALAVSVVDGDLIRNPDADGLASLDIYIVKVVGTEKFKRLILSPHVFESYEHFDKNGNGDNWDDVMDVDQATMDAYTTTDLVREDGNDKVYRLYAADGTDSGDKYWLNMTAAEFTAVFNANAIYTINSTDTAGYTAGSNVTNASATFPPVGDVVASEGTLTVTLAANTPAASIAVGSAARMPFTKINLTATNGDVIVDSMVIERVGLANDLSFASIDIIDGGTNLPINITSKTFNSLHQATFNDNFTVSNGTTKSIIIAGNMASKATLGSYAGEVPSLSLAAITLVGDATLSASLPLTGNAMTINSTIVIGSATIQRGAYSNATSSAIQVGKEDYTYFSFQVQAGSAEDIEFSQVKVYQEGSASLGTDLINLELLQDGTKIADGVVASSKYVNFSFDAITLSKGQIAQFQVKGDVADGSARTIILGVYKTTDLLVKGLTYEYNITPTYSGTGSSASSPVLMDNEFTISNGTLQVTRSSSIGADNIGIANDQYLGAFTFTVKGEIINVSALTLTVATTGNPGDNSNNANPVINVELVDPSGNVVAGPTDPSRTTGVVSWTDTFAVPIGETIYKVRGDLQTSAAWASNDTVLVRFTPSAMTATGETTGNAISASPSSAVSGNTQTVKAASLTVTRNTLPANANIIVGQSDLILSSWRFDATDSGEDIRVTSVGFTALLGGFAATNTNALTIYVDGVAKSPINDAIADSSDATAASSTFAFDDPIIIVKGSHVTVELHGDKDTVTSDDTENWGMGGNSVTAYGVNTGNTVLASITADDGPTLTSKPNGTLTIETSGNPTSAIVLAGSIGNIFTNIKLSADYEDMRLDQLIVHVIDGGYAFSDANASNYQDVTNVSIYDGITLLANSSIPSTNQYTFNFNAGDLTIPKGGSKTLTIKADMATVDKSTDNSPGTNSADIIIGLNGGAAGIKTTGLASNAEITGSTYEDFRSSSSSVMIMRSSIPTVTLPTASNSLGAATTLINGTQIVYAYKVSADADGGDVLLYRNTFVFATSGANTIMTITNVYIADEQGNTIKAIENPSSMWVAANTEQYYTATFNNPDFDVTGATTDEAIKITAGTSKTFYVYATMGGVDANESLTTFLVGDLASTTATVGSTNVASAPSYPSPTTDMSTVRSNFVWSDNFKQNSLEGTDGNNATSTAQWYNGHLVPGLGNVVSTTAYVLFSS